MNVIFKLVSDHRPQKATAALLDVAGQERRDRNATAFADRLLKIAAQDYLVNGNEIPGFDVIAGLAYSAADVMEAKRSGG